MISNNKLKQYHHVRITEENRMDLTLWKVFLSSQATFNTFQYSMFATADSRTD